MNNIEKAKVEDAKQICRIINQQSKKGSVLNRSVSEVKLIVSDPNKGAFYILRDQNKVVACASIEIYTPRLAEIRSVVVLEAYRSSGVGKLLINKCLSYGRKKQITKIIAFTDKVGFFKKLGFKEYLKDQKVVFIS